jgi:hypothetical protein
MFLDLFSLANLDESPPHVFLQVSVSPQLFHLFLNTLFRERDHFHRYIKLSLLTFTEKKRNVDKLKDLAWIFSNKRYFYLECIWNGMDFADTSCSDKCLPPVRAMGHSLSGVSDLMHCVLSEANL